MNVAVLGPNKPFWGARIVQIPFFRALRERHPGARVTVITPVDAGDFVAWGLADGVLPYRRGGGWRGWAGPPVALRRAAPDAVYNLRRWSVPCGLAATLSRGRRVGFAGGLRARWLDERVRYDSTIYLAARYLSLVEAGVRDGADDRSIPLFRKWATELVAARPESSPDRTGRVVLFPGAGEPAKRWPVDRFVALGASLTAETDTEATLVIGPDEQDLTVRVDPGQGVEIVVDPPIETLLALVLDAALVVSNDCGPSHLGQLSGRRFLGLHRTGWNTAEDWFLDKKNSDLLLSRPGEGMESLTFDEVLERARALFGLPDYAGSFVRFSRREASTPRARRS
jgi:ADP-heptose:LPS heptosyltransferase